MKMPAPPTNQASVNVVKFEQIVDSVYGHRTIVYGPGGVGKSTLACLAEGPVAFVDADESLGRLKSQLLANNIPMPVRIPAHDYTSLRSALQASGYDKIKTVVLDTWEPVHIWIIADVLRSHNAKSIEEVGGGFGKGYVAAYERSLCVLSDLDKHARAGRNVIIIMHDVAQKVPNPAGQDFLRWEPNAQHTTQASTRYRMKAWADHVLFLTYDAFVEKQAGDTKGQKVGKAKGVGERILHTAEMPHFMGKSRTTSESFTIELGASPWSEIFK
jgi:hypothetical protein